VAVGRFADGVVVGSALVRAIEEGRAPSIWRRASNRSAGRSWMADARSKSG